MNNANKEIREIIKVSIMTVLVFLATYFAKINSVYGYVHLGDSMVFLSIYLLGIRKSAISSAVGAALADLAGGYFIWVLPTFFIKLVMVFITGTIMKGLKKIKYSFIIAPTIGGIFQILAYCLLNFYLYGKGGIILVILLEILQTSLSIILFLSLLFVFNKTGVNKFFKK